ncbi:uncharacterized protein LOC126664438 isoform X2 [Mercurialis annua]|uniref:uncharacterized protein LOC126664438 isoform X2 n=1 Tax=Mercurialis annua TaxID=3986 RepID=UPI00215F5C7A|nr:uncharacterized protein LOC126664438 isoform X2 [Mercurialis annua]
MNASRSSDLIQENIINNNDNESDSDTNSDLGAPEYYQPIAEEDGGSDEELQLRQHEAVENGISSLHLNGGDLEEDDEEEIVEEAAIVRAFREDENRRNAPLNPENAIRVMEAMRGISFSGSAPDWAGRVPEDQWIHQIRSLRSPQQQQQN